MTPRARYSLPAVVVALATGLARSAQAPVSHGASSIHDPGARDPGYVYPRADLLTYKETPEGKVVTLSGNAILEYRDTVLRTDLAAFNEKTQVAVSPGRVQVDDAQNTVIGDRGVAYYKKRTAEIIGNVHLTARPRPADQNAPEGSMRREFKQPVLMTCDRVLYNWRTRVAIPTGSLTLMFSQKKERWTVTADNAVYDGRAERAVLTGNVRGVSTLGEDIRAEKATVLLKEGAESLQLDKTKYMKIKVDEDKDEDTSAPLAPANPGKAAPAPGASSPTPSGPRPGTGAGP